MPAFGTSGTATTTPAAVAINGNGVGVRNKGTVAIQVSFDGGSTYPVSVPANTQLGPIDGVATLYLQTASGSAAYEIVGSR